MSSSLPSQLCNKGKTNLTKSLNEEVNGDKNNTYSLGNFWLDSTSPTPAPVMLKRIQGTEQPYAAPFVHLQPVQYVSHIEQMMTNTHICWCIMRQKLGTRACVPHLHTQRHFKSAKCWQSPY